MTIQLVEVSHTKKDLFEYGTGDFSFQMCGADERGKEVLLYQIKELYLQAFPKEERKPFELIEKLQEEGKAQIFVVTDEEREFCGLAITLHNGNYVLLDYFAILPQKRGSGIGSCVIQLLKQRYKDKIFFLEIEETEKMEDVSEEEQKLRVRRKRFYLENGMKDSTLRVSLFGVLMEILSDGTPLTFEEYYELYKTTVGENFIKKRILLK